MENGFRSFGFFAKKRILKGDDILGLVGFWYPTKEIEIVEGVNDVSVYHHQTGSTIMLRGVSFINYSCRENSIFVYILERTMMGIRVTSGDGLFPGDEKSVLYSGTYFGPNRMFCERLAPKY